MYKHLTPYVRPSSYAGPDWPDHFVVYSQHRDSDALTRSNFVEILRKLGGETGEDDDGIADVVVIRDRHWAVGWIETLRVACRRADLCQVADDLLEAIAQYPILNEDTFSELEYTEACQTWAQGSVADRLDWLARSVNRWAPHVSPFAARRADLPDDHDGSLLERLRG